LSAQFRDVCPISCGTTARRTRKRYDPGLYPVKGIWSAIDVMRSKMALME